MLPKKTKSFSSLYKNKCKFPTECKNKANIEIFLKIPV